MGDNLTLKMRTFALAYVGEANGNGTEAARIAGYKGNDVTLGAVAYENLNKPQIKAFIAEIRAKTEKRLEREILSAAEVLAELSDIAIAPWRESIEIKYDNEGTIVKATLRLSDKIKACELIGKHHGLFPTQIKVSPNEIDDAIDKALRDNPALPAGTDNQLDKPAS